MSARDATSWRNSLGEVCFSRRNWRLKFDKLPKPHAKAISVTLVSLSALGGSLGGVVSNLLTGRAIQAFGYVPVFTVISVLPLTAFVSLELMMRRTRRSGAIGS